MPVLRADERAIIRAHAKDTTCFVVGEDGHCLELARARAEAMTGRLLRHLRSSELPAALPDSWMVAVILCPGDSTEAVASWASRLEVSEARRILFYESFDLDLVADRVYAGWIRHGLPDPVRQRVHDFKELNRRLGSDLNMRILEDHE